MELFNKYIYADSKEMLEEFVPGVIQMECVAYVMGWQRKKLFYRLMQLKSYLITFLQRI